MGKSFVLVAFVLSFTTSVFAGQPAEKVVVEKSPFARTFFMVYSNANGTSHAVIKGEQDAIIVGTPNGKLYVGFSEVVQDKDSMTKPNNPSPWFVIEWEKVEINIDPSVKGVAVSYERQIYPYYDGPEKLVLTVSSEYDKNLWRAKAEKFYSRYLFSFWGKREEMIKAEKASVENEQALRDTLKRGPIYVFPED